MTTPSQSTAEVAPEPAEAPARPSRPFVLALALVTLALLGACVPTIRGAFAYLNYPFAMENGEGICLAFARAVHAGGIAALYPELDSSMPFLGCNYPPMYFKAWALLSGNPALPLVFEGRLLSLLSLSGILVLIASISRAVGAGKRTAIVAPFLALATAYFGQTALLARVDTLAVFLSLASVRVSLAALSCAPGRLRPLLLHLLAGVLGGLALLTKQTAMLCLVAAAAGLLLAPQPDRRIHRVGALIAGAALPLVVVILLSRGRLIDWVVAYSFGEFDATLIRDGLLDGWTQAWPLALGVAGAAALGVHSVFRQCPDAPPRDPVRGTFAIFAALALLSLGLLGKVGSSRSYVIEPVAVAAVLSAFALERLRESLSARPRIHSIAAAAVVLIAASAFLFQHRTRLSTIPNPAAWNSATREAKLFRYYTTTRPPVLAEDCTTLQLAGNRAWLANPFLYTELAARGFVDASKLLGAIQRGEPTFIVLESDPAAPSQFTRKRMGFNVLATIDAAYPHKLNFRGRWLCFRTQAELDRAKQALE